MSDADIEYRLRRIEARIERVASVVSLLVERTHIPTVVEVNCQAMDALAAELTRLLKEDPRILTKTTPYREIEVYINIYRVRKSVEVDVYERTSIDGAPRRFSFYVFPGGNKSPIEPIPFVQAVAEHSLLIAQHYFGDSQ